ncbi:MAG: ribonuclease HII, partial [Epsilonproteobacteria bacterium]|nr:ribonuclease HII [Campylobacterota bacterium]
MKKLCGIDEAGRGPLAGPLCVAGVVFKNDITTIQEFA